MKVLSLLIVMFGLQSESADWVLMPGAHIDTLINHDPSARLYIDTYIEEQTVIEASALDLAIEYQIGGKLEVLNAFIDSMKRRPINKTGRDLIEQTLNSQKATRHLFSSQKEQLLQTRENLENSKAVLNQFLQLPHGGRFFVNGYEFDEHELRLLNFVPTKYFHIFWMSNGYAPISYIAKGSDINIPQAQALISGSCRQPLFSHFAIEQDLKFFFSDLCVADTKLARFNKNSLMESKAESSKLTTKTKYLIWGTVGIVAGIFAYNYFKNQQVSVEIGY